VRCVLLVALVGFVAPAVLVTAGEPRAGEIPDAPVLSLEQRNRGPPVQRCDSPGRR